MNCSTRWVGSIVAIGLASVLLVPITHGQAKIRRNKAIARLERGKVACGGFSTGYNEEAEIKRTDPDLDFIFYDMEHRPYDIPAFRLYAQFLIWPEHPVPRIALLARIPAYGREMNQWQVKQVLDSGGWGVIVPHLETAEQALNLVRAARYPQPYGVKDFQPEGQRGKGVIAKSSWGVSQEEYERIADSWPLDPDGELLITGLIENQLGAANARDIARVPGISGIAAVAFSGDEGLSYRYNETEIEKHNQTILAANKEFNKIPMCFACTKHGTVAEAEARIKEGWRMLAVGGCAEARRNLGMQ